MDLKAELLDIEAKLIKNPNDAELLALKQDLLELMELENPTENVQTTVYEVGAQIGAKYTDGVFYKATITNILDNIFTVQFEGYPELHTVSLEDLCPLNDSIKSRRYKSNDYLKRKKEKKKKRLEEKRKEESKELEKSQQNWQKFKKTVKKIEKIDNVVGTGSTFRLHK